MLEHFLHPSVVITNQTNSGSVFAMLHAFGRNACPAYARFVHSRNRTDRNYSESHLHIINRQRDSTLRLCE
jgi:hypothetical protein